MAHDYFAAEAIVEAMQHDHLCIWLEMIDAVKPALRPGCRVLDFGCSSGELVRILCRGVPGLLDPVNPSLAVGLEQESMREVLDTATARTPGDLPVLFSHAPLEAFPCQFDVILSHEVLYLLDNLSATFKAAHLSLRPGGVLCAATAGYVEHEYYRRWQPLFEQRGIGARQYSMTSYTEALAGAGFAVEIRQLCLAQATYDRWRSVKPFDDREWFTSAADERRYFTQVGKLMLIGRKGGSAERNR